MTRLEAVLFVAKEPLNTRKLSRYANLADGTQARTLIGRMNQIYDETGRAFRVEEVAGGFQLRTRPVFSRWLRRMPHVPPETRLSVPSLETLAVVAYRQPVVRADVESIRGVACGELLRQLMERDLVRVSGRSEELGRPYFYSTTKRFLEVFGLRNLDELPRADEFELALAGSNVAVAVAAAEDPHGGVPSKVRSEDDDEEWDDEDDDELGDDEEWDDEDDDLEEDDDEDGDDAEDDEWEEEDDEWEEVDDEDVEEDDDGLEEDEEWEEEWDDDDEEEVEEEDFEEDEDELTDDDELGDDEEWDDDDEDEDEDDEWEEED